MSARTRLRCKTGHDIQTGCDIGCSKVFVIFEDSFVTKQLIFGVSRLILDFQPFRPFGFNFTDHLGDKIIQVIVPFNEKFQRALIDVFRL